MIEKIVTQRLLLYQELRDQIKHQRLRKKLKRKNCVPLLCYFGNANLILIDGKMDKTVYLSFNSKQFHSSRLLSNLPI